MGALRWPCLATGDRISSDKSDAEICHLTLASLVVNPEIANKPKIKMAQNHCNANDFVTGSSHRKIFAFELGEKCDRSLDIICDGGLRQHLPSKHMKWWACKVGIQVSVRLSWFQA